MAKMSDEMQDWFDEIRDKKITARGAKNRRGGGGRRGPAKLPSDYLTEKQLRAMNGEVATYRLGAPMGWREFSNMPDDLKVMYIKKLRKQYNVPDKFLADVMGIDISAFWGCINSLGLRPHRPAWTVEEQNVFKNWWVISERSK